MTGLEKIYQEHHSARRRQKFAVLEPQRGELFKKLIGKGKKVLDIGCRDGVITKYFIEGNKVTGVDIDSSALENARKDLGIETVHLDIQDEWPFEKGSFDVIVAAEILGDIYFPSLALAKIKNILKPGGFVVGSVPNAFSLKNRLKYLLAKKNGTPLEDPMHIGQFGWTELGAMLAKEFEAVELFPLGRSNFGLKNVIPGLFSYSVAFKAKKRRNF